MKASPLPEEGSVRDVVVIGAGPAGCAAAVSLCRLGLDVLLLERREMPRWKVCGCCLEGSAVRVLEALGVAPRLARHWVPLHELRLEGWGLEARLPADGRAVSRQRLDLTLAAAARDAGASVCWPVRARLREGGGGLRRVSLRTPEGPRTVRARLVIGAWGLAGGPRAPAPDAAGRASASGTGGRIGLGGTLPADRLELPPGQVRMLVGDRGYVGLVRVEEGTVNVAAALRAGRLGAARPFEVVAEMLTAAGVDAEVASGIRWTGTPPLRRLQPRVRDRLITVGDAAGFWEPFTGEGIAWALDAGVYVGPPAAGLLADWSDRGARRLARGLRRRMLLRQARSRAVAAIAGHPSVARLALRVVARLPSLARPLRPSPAAGSERELT